MSGESEYDVETMFGGPVPKVTNATCVFWDVDDCPIPNELDLNLIYQNIKSALVNNGYNGSLEIKLFGDKKPFSDDLILDSEITFVPKAPEGSLARAMLLDILAWALDHPPSCLCNRHSYVMVMSQYLIKDTMLVETLKCLRKRAYDVLLAQSDLVARKLQPQSKVLPFKVPSVWIWTSLIAGGDPIIGQGGGCLDFDF